jgi:hypothetical protein
VIECLPRKLQDLNLISSTIKNKRKGRGREERGREGRRARGKDQKRPFVNQGCDTSVSKGRLAVASRAGPKISRAMSTF